MTKRAMRKPHIFKVSGQWCWSPPIYKPEPRAEHIDMCGRAMAFVFRLNNGHRYVEMGQS